MGISSVSVNEYVNLIGHYQRIKSPKPKANIKSRGYSKEALAALQARLDATSSKNDIRVLDLHITGSLDQFYFPNLSFLLTLEEQYSKFGSLPYKGTITDQPAKVIELFSIIASMHSEEKLKMYEAQKKELNRKNGKR